MQRYHPFTTGASSGAHRKGHARRTAPSLRSAHRLFSILTLIFFIASMLSPLTLRTAFAEGETTEVVQVEETAPNEVAAAEEPAAFDEQTLEVTSEPAAPDGDAVVVPSEDEVAEPEVPADGEAVAPEVAAPVVNLPGAVHISLYGTNGEALSGLFAVTDAAGVTQEVWVQEGFGVSGDLAAGTATVVQVSGTPDYAFDGVASYAEVPSGDVAALHLTNAFIDTDGDGMGDSADATPNGDTDGDGVDNLADATPNGDTDGDGIDNLIDETPDGEIVTEAQSDVDVPVVDLASEATAELTVEVSEDPVVVADAEAVACVEAETAAPWIASGLDDYPPGSLVTLTGGGWVAGQAVEIFVDDDGVADDTMGPWSHSATVVADEAGNLSYEFSLAAWFVLHYTVVATGECSTASTAFTDGNVEVSVTQVRDAEIHWRRFVPSGVENVTCSGSPTHDGMFLATRSSRTLYPVDQGASIELVAPATEEGFTFIGWTRDGVLLTSEPTVCIPGSASYQIITANYGLSTSVTNITATASMYNGTTTLSASVSPEGVQGNVTFYINGSTVAAGAVSFDPTTGVATLSNYTHGLNASVTPYSVRAVFVPSETAYRPWSLTQSEATNPTALVVSQPTATITLTIPTDVVYDGTPKVATATTDPAGLSPVSITYGGSATPPTDAGSYEVVATLENANYTAAPATGTLVIGIASHTITFGPLSDTTYGEDPVSISGTASSGLAVDFSSQTTTVCTVSSATVNLIAAGTCTIQASQAGNTNYNAAEDVVQSFEITARGITVTADGQSMTFGQDVPPLTYSITTGTLVSDDTLAGAPGVGPVTGPGTYAIGIGSLQTENPNYSITFIGADLTVEGQVCVSEIQSPFKSGTRNVVKYGSVVPVKVRVTDCISGAPVTDAAPTIQVYLRNGSTPEETAILVTSSSSADSGTYLRHTGDGYYIYNLSTKSGVFSDPTATYRVVVTVEGEKSEGDIGLKK